MNLMLQNIKSCNVVRASNGKSANTVRVDGNAYISVWPRDVAEFKKQIATGSIAVSVRATLGYAENGATIGEAHNVKVDDKGTPQLRVEYTFVSAGGSLDQLVEEKEAELVGESAPPPASP